MEAMQHSIPGTEPRDDWAGRIAEAVLRGELLTREQARRVLQASDADVPTILSAAFRVRQHHHGRRAFLVIGVGEHASGRGADAEPREEVAGDEERRAELRLSAGVDVHLAEPRERHHAREAARAIAQRDVGGIGKRGPDFDAADVVRFAVVPGAQLLRAPFQGA